MAAAGTAARKASWIARMWREGWEKIPAVMAAHCLSTPCLIYIVGDRLLFGRPVIPPEKYRMYFTVVRPDDPRVARINHESKIDRVGFFD